MSTRTMHPVAIAVWSVFIAFVVALELLDPGMEHTRWWVGAAVYFAIAEAIGGIRRHRGDMLSEAMWAISAGKWGRRVFTGSFGLYFAQRLYMLGAPGDFPQLPIWLPWLTLIVGFAVWIATHFYTEGRAA